MCTLVRIKNTPFSMKLMVGLIARGIHPSSVCETFEIACIRFTEMSIAVSEDIVSKYFITVCSNSSSA